MIRFYLSSSDAVRLIKLLRQVQPKTHAAEDVAVAQDVCTQIARGLERWLCSLGAQDDG